MFSKGSLVFGLLVIFTFEVSNAQSVETLEKLNIHLSKSAIGDLVDQIKEIISSLNELLSGVIGDALATLRNLISVIQEIKEKFLDEGIELVMNITGEVAEYIKNRTIEAAEAGVDIAVCIHGREEQIRDLQVGLIANFSRCIGDAAENVLITVNNEIEVINAIVRNITRLPVELSKCLISLRPITCLTQLLQNASEMLLNLPVQIAEIVNLALGLVTDLPINMAVCKVNIGESAGNQTQQIIEEIGNCIDDEITGNLTTAATTTLGI